MAAMRPLLIRVGVAVRVSSAYTDEGSFFVPLATSATLCNYEDVSGQWSYARP